MLPYFLANFCALGILSMGLSIKLNKFATFTLYLLAAIPLIIIVTFKAVSVGTDTVSYVFFFKQLASFENFIAFSLKQGEFGFWYLNYLGHKLTNNHYIIFLFSATIITACYFFSINSLNLKLLSVITLLFIGPYYFQMNGTRQAIAIAIFAVSIVFILKKKPFFYFISILIGLLFHKSIILLLPIYYLLSNKIKTWKVIFMLFIFLIVLVFFQSFISIASDIDPRYSSYGNSQETKGGLVVSSFNIFLFIWFLFCRKINKKFLPLEKFDCLLTLYFLGTLISIVSVILNIDPSGFLRLSVYFIQTNIFLVPMTILSFKENSTRYVIYLLVLLFMILYFALTLSKFSHLTPYKFNPILMSLYES